ncbi:MAG: 3-oxo-5-alpha-steroid 4-dehydrogenase [Gammaproteobacteria bacterium]|nr:3-oxo-5-alpha-steroid 4-dehydrogenase [Gammaproteobacteria bacterium]
MFELPALVTFPAIYLASANHHLVGNVVLGLWLAHYGHRGLVWCWLVPKRGATVPVAMCGASIGFNLVNGALLGWFMGYVAEYAAHWLTDPRFVVGIGLFAVGAGLNVWADYRLRYLRRLSRQDRVVPTGGPFRFACCPNLTGEIIEWVGFALLTWSLPGLAFALWTIANLVPRALWRRTWYRGNFDDFPRERAALVPGIL